VATAELTVHRSKPKKLYSVFKASHEHSKKNDDVLDVSFDYMPYLQLPRIPAQHLFYPRQLTACFCVHDMKSDIRVMYHYREGSANTGTNKVCSLLYHYSFYCVPTNIKELHLFSANCLGQDKNHTVIRFLQALTDSGKFKKIHQFFPIKYNHISCATGVSQLSNKVEWRRQSLHYAQWLYSYCSDIQRSCKFHSINSISISTNGAR
jgi:hypothetical protein